MTAVLLSRIFMGIIGVVAIGIVFSFIQLTTMLSSKVTETDRARIEAEVSRLEIEKLKKLGGDLSKQKDIVERAKDIVASGALYQYQDQIVSDINAYANLSGIAIKGFDFSSASAVLPKSAPAPAGGTTATAKASKIAATVNLGSPLSYDSFIKFISLIERNLTKIQITNITLTPEEENPNLVTNPSIGIEVNIKN